MQRIHCFSYIQAGVLHTTGGYMVYIVTTFKYAFDNKSSDIYWCTADCGWITGHSYVTYGPMLSGASVLVFEGYPDAGQCWNVVDKYKVTIFCTAKTLTKFTGHRASQKLGVVKIMRRILWKMASKQLDELGDTSTLADPYVVEQLIALGDDSLSAL